MDVCASCVVGRFAVDFMSFCQVRSSVGFNCFSVRWTANLDISSPEKYSIFGGSFQKAEATVWTWFWRQALVTPVARFCHDRLISDWSVELHKDDGTGNCPQCLCGSPQLFVHELQAAFVSRDANVGGS